MNSLSFNCLFTNAAFPSKVMLKDQCLMVEIQDFHCMFEIITTGEATNYYIIHYPTYCIEYFKSRSLLRFKFILKEMALNGKSQLHELPNLIEKNINRFLFHSSIVSNKIEEALNQLTTHHILSIETLTHESTVILIRTRSYGDIRAKIYVKNDENIAISSPLLTTSLFEHYFEMRKPLELEELLEHISNSAEFQLILDDSLKSFSEQALKSYTKGSYAMVGLVCTANSYNEIHLCYMKEMILSIRISTFPYTLEIIDLANFCTNLKKIRKLDGCLHHAMTKALKDPELQGFKNTVVLNAPEDTFQVLELHKPEHVKSAILFILNYVHLIYLFEYCKKIIDENLRILKTQPNRQICVWKLLDLRIDLAHFEEYRYNAVLKMKNNPTGLEVDFDIEVIAKRENEPEKLERWKRVLLTYFHTCVKPYCKGCLELMGGFVKLFMVSLGIIGIIIDVLEEEMNKRQSVEFIWPCLSLTNESCRFAARVWDQYGKSSDIQFLVKEVKESREISTNLDPSFLSHFNQKECNPLDLIKFAQTRRSDELRFRKNPDAPDIDRKYAF